MGEDEARSRPDLRAATNGLAVGTEPRLVLPASPF